MFHAFAVAAILVALAELGDKTQLLTLALAARYRTWQVVTGVLSAILALQLIATAAGSLVGELLPGSWLAVLTGALFIGFGIWTIRGDGGAEEMAAARGRYGVVLTVTAAFFIAELGDKTQVLTMAIAADPGAVLRAFGTLGPALEGALGGPGAIGGAGRTGVFVGVWLGSALGMALANGLALLAGALLGRRLPRRLIARVSGAVFIAFGLLALASAPFR